jgi:DNA invertase Pin-like site-specific DNA recombinase
MMRRSDTRADEDLDGAGLAEFERDLLRERVKSGLAAARSRGVALGRQLGQRPSDKKAKKVLQCTRKGLAIA